MLRSCSDRGGGGGEKDDDSLFFPILYFPPTLRSMVAELMSRLMLAWTLSNVRWEEGEVGGPSS